MAHKTTLYEMLKLGYTVEFPSGYKLKGDPQNGYIDLTTPNGPDGLESLTLIGVDNAIEHEKKWREDNA